MKERHRALGFSIAATAIAAGTWQSSDSGMIFASYLYTWFAIPLTLLTYFLTAVSEYFE